jgi:hypothetical protein
VVKLNCGVEEINHYVPILEMLKALLSRKDILDAVLQTPTQVEGTISSFRDGSLYKSNRLFSNGLHNIVLKLYLDEFEVVNPLGDSRGTYKLTGVYYQIMELNNSSQSRLQSIYLAMLYFSSHVSKYTLRSILKPLVNDICELESDGILIKAEGKEYKVSGSSFVICGDNLGQNKVGGFVESFSENAKQYCRFCTGPKELIMLVFIIKFCDEKESFH